MDVLEEGGHAAFAAGELPSEMLDDQLQFQRERGGAGGGRAQQLLQRGVHAQQVAVVEVVIPGAGDGRQRRLSGAEAGEGLPPLRFTRLATLTAIPGLTRNPAFFVFRFWIPAFAGMT